MPIGKKKTLITVLVLFGALLLASAAAVMLPPEKRTAQAASPEGIPLTASFTGASLENGKAYYLANDIALSAALEITGKNVAIDLNGHKLAIADGAQSVMRVTGDNTVVTVKDSDPNSAHADTDIRGGMITGSNNQTQYNSGVYLDGAAVFNMYGGSIAENASSCGGGVSMHGTSTFNMYGGSIVGNTAKATGGGANLSGQPVFNMYGGSIVGNASGGSGGGANVTGGVFNMSGGSVIGNKITAYGFSGGGVYVAGTGVFNVSGAPEISGNKVVANNDNVHLVNTNVAKITVVGDLRDGSGKKAKKFVASPFPKNSAFTSGYGEKCGGVSPSEYFFADDGGCVQASVGEVTVGSHSWNDDGSCGSCAQIATVVVADHGEGASTHCFASFDDAWKYANDNKDAALAIRLADDVATENLLIRGFTDLTIDLNGKMLSLADGETDSVISVDDSKFTLDDGEKSKAEDKKTPHDIGNGVTVRGGTVTGGNGYGGRGGGVYVWSGTFDMAGGTIAGNIFIPDNDIRQGGGVYINSGAFNMKGGAISHNGGAKRGGGVYLQSGTFTMSGGTISDNASEYGGGVYVWSGTFDMRGGAVTGNRASIGSGGVFMPDSGVFKVSGKVSVTGNKQADDVNNVKLDDEDADITITVVGALAEGAEIGICNTGAVASGFTAAMGDPSDFFVPDDTKNNCVYINSKNSLVTIGKHAPEANDDCTVATKCSNCGKVTAATQTRHLWSDTYESDGTGHWKKCTRSGCNGTDTKSEHTVGTAATCTSGAVCGVCRAVYGQTNADNHAFGTFQAEIPAACTTAGTKGHKDCTLCGKHFDNGGTEISDLTIPALGHDWNDGGVCSVCGAEAKCTVKISFDAPVYYDTFENAWSAAVGSGHAARVTMLDDKELSETLVLEENNVIDLDLNGHALRYTGAVGSVVLIKDKEYLTIIDITDSGRITGGKGRADDGDTVKKGGGVYIEKGGKLLMRGGSISGNTADQGGGVYMAGGEFIMREGSITGNTASSKGGGMYIIVGYGVGSAELGGGEISENNAQYGGGIYVGGGSPQLKWTDISRNTAEVHGGGMYIEKDGSTVSGGSISGNIAQSSGGGIYVGGSSVINIKDIAEISGNTAVSQGGGVYVGNAGKANISGGSISGNTADQGGGAYIAGKTNMTGAVAITDNSSSSYGGGVLVVTDNFDVGSGSVTVGGNKRVEGDPGSTEEIADNVYLWNGKKIKISADPGSARIGVSGNIGTFTDGFGRAFFGTSAPSASIYFYSDKGYCVGKSDGEACLLADHNFSTDYTVDKAPTCTQAGSESRHCTRCGTKTDERAIAAAHSYGDPVYTWSGDNTACTAKRGCTGSGCTAEQIAAATVTSATTAPTCTEGGYDTLTAVFTGGVFSTQTKKVNITSARHTWGAQSVRVEPTCTADGSVTGTCTVCGETDVEILTKLGHDLTRHDAKAPTCTESGFTAYETCSRCDHTTYAEIPALGHSLTHVARRGATAQADGNIEHWACDVCGGKFSDGNGENAVDNVIIKFRLVKPSENGGEERVVVTTPEGFAPDIELVVTEIEKENYGAYETIANTVNGEIDLVYDVTLKSGGVTVQPDGTLTIRLRIPDNLLGKDFKLFHLHGSEATDMEYAVDGNYAVVTADRLSEFIFVGKKKAAKNDLAPLWITLIIILSIVIVGEVGYIAYKYVRKNKAAGGR